MATPADILARALRRRALPRLREAAPERTGDLRRGLDVAVLDSRTVAIGVLHPPYTQGRNEAHPGVYGYIHHQVAERRDDTAKGWFEATVERELRLALRSVLPELADAYIKQNGGGE